MAHSRFQREYLEHLREQQRRLRYEHDYENDPYFYTAPIYRYYRGGRYYHVNRYAADLLQQAINNGYEEGYHAGRADREDGWRFDYQNCYAYEDATFGYTGYYLDLNEYRYYFREGFRRGYTDGYYGRYQYGRYYDGKYSILAAVLSRILNLMPLH
ncbi:MAG TPA: hypothetical protein VID27_12445 [Blastocatellia bacterium]